MKKPMTTAELFEKICDILKAEKRMPEILDYSLPARETEEITTADFVLRSNLDYGGSEGIYLDLWLECQEDGACQRKEMGTFKTLRDDYEAMKLMGLLLVDFIVQAHLYVRINQDDFIWEGANISIFDENGKKLNWGYFFRNMEQALVKKEELLQKYPKVIVRDNGTRREEIFEKDTMV